MVVVFIKMNALMYHRYTLGNESSQSIIFILVKTFFSPFYVDPKRTIPAAIVHSKTMKTPEVEDYDRGTAFVSFED